MGIIIRAGKFNVYTTTNTASFTLLHGKCNASVMFAAIPSLRKRYMMSDGWIYSPYLGEA